MFNKNNFILTLFILVGVLTRIIPHPPNFTAIGAIALFGGAFFVDKKLSFLIPISIMLISDFLLGYQMILSVYISFLIMVFLGFRLAKKHTTIKIINTSIIASIIFFIITNLSVFLTSALYSKNVLGLIECYTLAIPFFMNTLVANIFYSILMFNAFSFVKKRIIIDLQ
tara:strand:- start:1538 stop:2044 length:507 start_codon:yes stop_codon:yes gene_type:complete